MAENEKTFAEHAEDIFWEWGDVVPFAGAPIAIAKGVTDFQQGNYVSGVLNLAGAIPGGGLIKGVGKVGVKALAKIGSWFTSRAAKKEAAKRAMIEAEKAAAEKAAKEAAKRAKNAKKGVKSKGKDKKKKKNKDDCLFAANNGVQSAIGHSADALAAIDLAKGVVASPVDAIYGNKILIDEEDVFLTDKHPIRFCRSYDSDITQSTVLGKGWIFSYGIYLEEASKGLKYITRHGREVFIEHRFTKSDPVFIVDEDIWISKINRTQYLLWNLKEDYFLFEQSHHEKTKYHLKELRNQQNSTITFGYERLYNSEYLTTISANDNRKLKLSYKEILIDHNKEVRLSHITTQYDAELSEVTAQYQYDDQGMLKTVLHKNNRDAARDKSPTANKINAIKNCYS